MHHAALSMDTNLHTCLLLACLGSPPAGKKRSKEYILLQERHPPKMAGPRQVCKLLGDVAASPATIVFPEFVFLDWRLNLGYCDLRSGASVSGEFPVQEFTHKVQSGMTIFENTQRQFTHGAL